MKRFGLIFGKGSQFLFWDALHLLSSSSNYKMIKMRLRRLLFALLFLPIALSAKEGMWIPMLLADLNESEMKDLGMSISAEDIYSINQGSLKDAVVHFGGFCTGEVISSEGLVLTNHHCGFGAIQSHSSVENNYLRDGFWAQNRQEELPNDGLFVRFIKRIDDVTQRVLYEVTDDMTEKERAEKIKENIEAVKALEEEEYGFEAMVRPFYQGNQYYLFLTQTYNDVRLVGAPPSSIGKYGADTDNWMWPRHTGDFSLFRIYADADNNPAEYSETNVAYTPEHHLPISLAGIQPNDFTMVFGFPGSTDEYMPATELEMMVGVWDPAKIEIRAMALDLMGEAMRADEAVKIQYASTQAGLANSWKKWIGIEQGITATNAIEKKRVREEYFQNAVTKNRRFDAKYKTLLPNYSKLYGQWSPYVQARNLYLETCFRAIGSTSFAYQMRNLPTEFEEGAPNTAENAISAAKGHWKDYNEALERDLFVSLMANYVAKADANLRAPELNEWSNEKAEEMFNESMFTSQERFESAMSKGAKKMEKTLQKDDFFQLVLSMFSYYRSDLAAGYGNVKAQLDSMDRLYMQAQMEVFSKDRFFPDANSTLRLSYGKVEGFEPRDGVTYDYYTTLDGLVAKYQPGDYEFDLPPRILELHSTQEYGDYANEKGELPVCFIASNHTSGGNSGSPAINGKGELIGLNFDRVWEGTMSDYNFDESRCRNIMVDVRYVLFIIDKFAGAGYLVDEMDLVYAAEEVAEPVLEVQPEGGLPD